MLADFNHQAGRETRDKLYEAMRGIGCTGHPWTDEQVASFMASAVRQAIENCITITESSTSIEDAAFKLRTLIAPESEATQPAKEKA